MPLVNSKFAAPRFLRNPHIQTIYPAIFHPVPYLNYSRERIDTPDGDFLDIDWLRRGKKCVIIISHGLEGSSSSKYVRTFARVSSTAQYDLVSWNMRGCSGECNLLPNCYHSGKSEDLSLVIEHVRKFSYDRVYLLGVSVGGNITLKYLGESGHATRITAAATISVPLDLRSCAEQLAKSSNKQYMYWFLSSLRKKIRLKSAKFPHLINLKNLDSMRTFYDFDSAYTAPLNGFSSAEDYWSRASSLPLLGSIQVPTLILSALDDPFLGITCFPSQLASQSAHVFLETPNNGGHVGFFNFANWWELRVHQFLTQLG